LESGSRRAVQQEIKICQKRELQFSRCDLVFEKLVAKVADNSGTHREGNIGREKQLPSNG
jgi:hypothetical protein